MDRLSNLKNGSIGSIYKTQDSYIRLIKIESFFDDMMKRMVLERQNKSIIIIYVHEDGSHCIIRDGQVRKIP